MMSVGYDMYLQLLEEAVLEERGEKKASRTDCSADLTVSANLPESYIPSPEQRMDIYRRIAAVRTREESQDLLDELLDRYGEPPASHARSARRRHAARRGVRGGHPRHFPARRHDHLYLRRRDAGRGGDARLRDGKEQAPADALRRGIEPKLALRLDGGEKPLPAALELVESIAPAEGA